MPFFPCSGQRLAALLLLFLIVPVATAESRFAFSEEQVSTQWQALTGGMRDAFPSPAALRAEAERYPRLRDETLRVLAERGDDPLLAGLEGDLSDRDFEIISEVVVKAWAALFNGDFEKAHSLGRRVGPPGMFPALYARALQAQYVEQDAARRERMLREVMDETARLLQVQPEHRFARFGHAYAKSRLLEPMGTLAAQRTGYMEDIQKILDDLLAADPDNLYALTLQGGVYAGIIDKAGRFLARRRFNVTPEMVDQVFERALSLNPGFAAPYLEFALAMEKVWGSDRQSRINAMLEKASAVTPVSAEEALVVYKARSRLND